MALIDHTAAGLIRQWRESRGLSPEALAADIAKHARANDWGDRGAVDAHTIRRIERRGHVPGPRVAFVLASYFETVPHALWDARNRRLEAA